MSAPDLPPTPPPEFQIPNVYLIDPVWQRRFTYVWASVAGAAILYSLPHLYKSIRNGYTWTAIGGIWEDWSGKKGYSPVSDGPGKEGAGKVNLKPNRHRRAHGLVATVRSFTMWTPPHVGMDVGQVVLTVSYFVVLLLVTTLRATLMENPDRAGFIAIAQLPLVFLLGTKNSLLSLLLGAGRGWEKLNYLHRWSGRGLFLAAAVHGALWIRNHLEYGLPILGQQKETSGVACFGILCVVVLTSLRPVRAFAYQFFFVCHVLGFVSFFVTLRYHTLYAAPWIYPPLAFYGLDMLMRLLRFRVKDATLIPCDEHMTLISVDDCDGGWVAGQHVRVRVFFNARVMESHPLTIMCAPPGVSCLSSGALGGNGKMLFGARVRGDWTGELNGYATANSPSASGGLGGATELEGEGEGEGKKEKHDSSNDENDLEEEDDEKHGSGSGSGSNSGSGTRVTILDKTLPAWVSNPNPGARVHVMLDGPYGGSSVDLGEYESVLLVAGGSGATFTIGVLDELVGRVVRRGEKLRTRRVEFVWCVRSFGAIRWFSPMLTEIALAAQDSSLDLHISIFVTCLCDPEAVPSIPNSDVLIERPTCTQIIRSLLARPVPPLPLQTRVDTAGFSSASASAQSTVANCGGGLAVCAAGPESLIREAKNALARVALARGLRLGKVACHTELYAL